MEQRADIRPALGAQVALHPEPLREEEGAEDRLGPRRAEETVALQAPVPLPLTQLPPTTELEREAVHRDFARHARHQSIGAGKGHRAVSVPVLPFGLVVDEDRAPSLADAAAGAAGLDDRDVGLGPRLLQHAGDQVDPVIHVLFAEAAGIRARDDKLEVARDGRLVADAADRGADPVSEDALVERLGRGGRRWCGRRDGSLAGQGNRQSQDD
jgi:hypothetical protein